MDSFEEEKKYWLHLYENEEIDEATYRRNIDSINQRKRYSNSTHSGYFSNTYGSTNKNYAVVNHYIIKIVVLLITVLCLTMYGKSVDKQYIAVNNLGELSSPIQYSTTGSTTKTIDDTVVAIQYVATYTICGRVVKTYSYLPTSILNKLSPIDVGLTWGDLAKDENNSHVTWSNSGNRFLRATYEQNWYESFGPLKFKSSMSNSHLIPADDDIEKKIKAIKENEYIQMSGYLVNAYYSSENTKSEWKSSTNRLDSGNGACEIIYVTSIDWLTNVQQ
jgi:hypothetical protein